MGGTVSHTESDWESETSGYRKQEEKGVNFNPLTHRETVLDSLSRDKVCRPLVKGVLSTSETTARQQYTAVNGSKYKTAIKKPQIMLSTKLQQH